MLLWFQHLSPAMRGVHSNKTYGAVLSQNDSTAHCAVLGGSNSSVCGLK